MKKRTGIILITILSILFVLAIGSLIISRLDWAPSWFRELELVLNLIFYAFLFTTTLWTAICSRKIRAKAQAAARPDLYAQEEKEQSESGSLE